ncbi:hypothetical protein D9M68_625440 [compost metagenome]
MPAAVSAPAGRIAPRLVLTSRKYGAAEASPLATAASTWSGRVTCPVSMPKARAIIVKSGLARLVPA